MCVIIQLHHNTSYLGTGGFEPPRQLPASSVQSYRGCLLHHVPDIESQGGGSSLPANPLPKPHLNDRTPAQVVGVKYPYRNWQDIVAKRKITTPKHASATSVTRIHKLKPHTMLTRQKQRVGKSRRTSKVRHSRDPFGRYYLGRELRPAELGEVRL